VNGLHPCYNSKAAQRYLKKNILLEMTKDEFYNWCDTQEEKIMEFYAKGLTPSVQRKDEKRGYSLDNIEVLDNNTNRLEGAISSGKKSSKAIIGVNITTGETIEFSSGHEAARHGFSVQCIWACIHKKNQRVHKGYIWRFK
jgi:hypothetical protein